MLVESEIKELEEEKERLSQQTKVKWSEFWTRKTLRRPLIVTVVIQMSQQLSGKLFVFEFTSKKSLNYRKSTQNSYKRRHQLGKKMHLLLG